MRNFYLSKNLPKIEVKGTYEIWQLAGYYNEMAETLERQYKEIRRYYREKNNMSYQKLSDQLMLLGVDIHKQAIYNIEVGKRTIVDFELCAFAKCFGISVNDLTDEYFKKLK